MAESSSADFRLGEGITHDKQDLAWSSAVCDGRAHVSHREQTLLSGPQFCMAIDDYQTVEDLVTAMYRGKSVFRKMIPEALKLIILFALPGQVSLVSFSLLGRQLKPILSEQLRYRDAEYDSMPFRICVRKRPLMPFERYVGAYDVCSTDSVNTITLHEGKLARNGRQLSMTHRRYVADAVFSEEADNQTVCEDCVAPLLRWAEMGKNSTLLCFGQTGTGKTYTLNGALKYVAQRLVGWTVCISFYEVHGNKCYDLLSQRSLIHLRADENGTIHARGARFCTIENAKTEQILAVLQEGLSLRSSKVTERNPLSSRSHAVCSIELIAPRYDDSQSSSSASSSIGTPAGKNESLREYLERTSGSAKPRSLYGKITLVDLAGSERNYETSQMTAAEHKESADINFALMALKDCFRAYHTHLSARKDENLGNVSINRLAIGRRNGSEESSVVNVAIPHSVAAGSEISRSVAKSGMVRIPYRSTLLTKILKDCFTSGHDHRTTIIATVAPSPIDLQHSVNTLDHVVLMSPTLPKLMHSVSVEVPMAYGAALSNIPVEQWTPKQINAWLGGAERGRFAKLALPPNMDGAGLLQLSAENFAELFVSTELRVARQDNEGVAWVEAAGETNAQAQIGRALYAAIRRANQHALAVNRLQEDGVVDVAYE